MKTNELLPHILYSIIAAMLSGARTYRRVDLSQKLYDRMKYLFPDQKADLIAASILLSNTYSSVGNDQHANEVTLNRMKQFGRRVQVGLSWTQVNGELVVNFIFNFFSITKNFSSFLQAIQSPRSISSSID